MDFIEYFQSYDNYFWEWENEILSADSVFETLTILHGSTIAYERFVMEMLDLLSLDGFPPFGSLLLTLIATNANGEESLTRVFDIIHWSKTVQKEKEYPKGLTYARNFLNTLAQLPQEFKEGDKRKELLQFIFKDCHNRLSAERAKTIMQHYKEHKHLLIKCANKLPLSEANLNKDFKTLAHLSVKYTTPQSLLNALTGVVEIPALSEKVVGQEPEPASTGNFIDELINDPKTFPVGSLIHRIWGGLNIPLHHSAPSHQPLGGISDLTNKGDFDKLLISEFANDDEVFMSRIANNEALYIKREVPPEADKFERLLLIDCSIKNWGTPKILAFASALAIAMHPKTDIRCRIFVMGNGYKEVTCETVVEVVEAMGRLGSALDAAPELELILNENADVKHSEVFLITSEDALASADTQRVFSHNHDRIKYIVTTETSGNLNFYKIQNRGRKLVQHIYLPLEELWSKNPTGSKESRTVYLIGDTVPEENYPILLPAPRKHMAVFTVKRDEFLLLTPTGQLFKSHVKLPENIQQFYRVSIGVELLLHDLSVKPDGHYALQLTNNDLYILAAFYPKSKYVSILNLNTREYHKKNIKLKGNPKDYSIFFDNGFFLFNEVVNECFRLEVHSGELMINDIAMKNNLAKEFKDKSELIKKYESSIVHHTVLLNFLPLIITKNNLLQLNKHCVTVNFNNPNHSSIDLYSNRNPEVMAESVYEKQANRFVFPDGSIVYRNALGIIMLKSSNPEIPHIYIPTEINTQLAMATDEHFAGNKVYYKGEFAQKIITIEAFYKKYYEPFINTIVTHGV